MQSKGFNAGGKKYEAEVISITNSDNEDNDHADENESANGNEVTDENETADENENKEKLQPGRLHRFQRALLIQVSWSVLLSLMENVNANLLAGLYQPSSLLRRRLSPMGLGSNCPKILIVGLPF